MTAQEVLTDPWVRVGGEATSHAIHFEVVNRMQVSCVCGGCVCVCGRVCVCVCMGTYVGVCVCGFRWGSPPVCRHCSGRGASRFARDLYSLANSLLPLKGKPRVERPRA